MKLHTARIERLNFACRDTATLSLYYGVPRIELFCPHCAPLHQRNLCLLDQPAHRLRLLKRAAAESRCAMCKRPVVDEYKVCPTCREKARARMREKRNQMKTAAHRKYAREKGKP